jgi:hypothetical protein
MDALQGGPVRPLKFLSETTRVSVQFGIGVSTLKAFKRV